MLDRHIIIYYNSYKAQISAYKELKEKGGTSMGYSNLLAEYGDILLPADVQKILHIGRNTVYGYLAKGTIRSIKTGGKYRIPKLYLLQYIYPDLDFEKETT